MPPTIQDCDYSDRYYSGDDCNYSLTGRGLCWHGLLSHEVSEFKIPLSIFPQLQGTVGFAAAAYAGGREGSPNFKLATWPKNYYRDIPVTWGELTFSAEPIPEFQSVWLIMGVAMLAALVLSRSGRKVEKRLHLL